MRAPKLLFADAFVNLLLGLVLLIFPTHLAVYLGVPIPASLFYPSLLGAVLFGIGLALLIEAAGGRVRSSGLGFDGAIAINICGSLVLALWLVSGRLELSTAGAILLWMVVVVVFGLAVFEWLFSRRSPARSKTG